MLIPCLNYLHIVLLSWNSDFVKILFSLLKLALHTKEWFSFECLEETLDLVKDIINIFNSEAKNVSSGELRCLQN